MKLATAWVVENTGARVSSANGRVWARSAQPPIRSTTISPSIAKANRAPSSRPSAKLASNAARTAAKRGGQRPEIGAGSAIEPPQADERRSAERGGEGGDRQFVGGAGLLD